MGSGFIQKVANQNTFIESIAQVAANSYIAGGDYFDGFGQRGALAKTTDNGVTWTSLDGAFSPVANSNVKWLDVAVSPATGAYVAVGRGAINGDTIYHWLVRQSTNGGTTWTTVDDFDLASVGQEASSIAFDSAGRAYVAGFVSLGGSNERWVVRRSSTSALTSWSTVDNFSLYDSIVHRAVSVFAEGNQIYVTGGVLTNGSSGQGMVRTTTDGSSWYILDDFISNFQGITEAITRAGGSLYTAHTTKNSSLVDVSSIRRLTCN